jgi:hypothetical protein
MQYKDVFDIGETVTIQVIFTWDNYLKKNSGRHKVEITWLDGEKVVAKNKGVYFYLKGGDAMYIAFIRGASIGPGRRAVELFVDGQKVVRKEFEVKEQRAAPE